MGSRDPHATQRRILDAARREFAAKGIAGARVDAIAQRAGANKRMLYYYFRSKEELFRETLRQRLVRRPGDTSRPAGSYPERLARRAAVPAAWREYTRLLMWEALEVRSGRGRVLAEEERRRIYDELRQSVREAQDAGELPADLVVDQMVLTELALIMFPVAFPQLVRILTGLRPESPEFIARREEHLRQLGAHLGSRRTPSA
jgi:TetR/AcrR family transcriptional regulator